MESIDVHWSVLSWNHAIFQCLLRNNKVVSCNSNGIVKRVSDCIVKSFLMVLFRGMANFSHLLLRMKFFIYLFFSWTETMNDGLTIFWNHFERVLWWQNATQPRNAFNVYFSLMLHGDGLKTRIWNDKHCWCDIIL